MELPRPVQRDDVRRLEARGQFHILEDLPRPFYRLDVPGEFLLTGIVSSARIRVTVRLAQRERALAIATEIANALVAPRARPR